MRAYFKNYRQSPRKVRLVADLIRGKKVDEAEIELDFVAKRAAHHFKKLLNSAVANAKHNFNIEKENLYVKSVCVDKGVTLHRRRARARGAAFPINKRSSHITLILAQRELKDRETPKEAKAPMGQTEKQKDIETKAEKRPVKKDKTKVVKKAAKAVKKPKQARSTRSVQAVKKKTTKTKAKAKKTTAAKKLTTKPRVKKSA